MGITFFSNWKLNKEFIFIEFSLTEDTLTLAFLGFGIVIVII